MIYIIVMLFMFLESLLFSMLSFICLILMYSIYMYLEITLMQIVIILLYVSGMLSLMTYTIYSFSYNKMLMSVMMFWLFFILMYIEWFVYIEVVYFSSLFKLMFLIIISLLSLLIVISFIFKNEDKFRKM